MGIQIDSTKSQNKAKFNFMEEIHMKIIEKEVVQIVHSFIADDGTEFSDAKECELHENMIKRQAFLEEISKLSLVDMDGYPPCDGAEYRQDYSYKWFEVFSEEDLDKLQLLCDGEIVVSSLPAKICIETNFDEEMYFVGTVESSIYYAKELLQKLGYDVTIKLKE